MRIGIFTECYNPVLNGVVVSINTFKHVLEQRGHEFYIFTTGSLDKAESDPHIIRFPVALPFKPKGGKYPLAWPQNAHLLAPKIAEYNLDLIHSQHLLLLGESGLKVSKILNIPSILTYHTLLTEYSHYLPGAAQLTRWWLIRKSRQICNMYDQVITPSPSMARLLRSYGVIAPIESIPTGVDVAQYANHFTRQDLSEKCKIPENKKLLLYVSRIAPEKNIRFLFAAIRRLIRRRQDFHLLMVGGGPDFDLYQNLAQKWGLKEVITFTNMQPREETVKYFGSADIFVFPSITETQGIVVTEAMAAGIPAVAVNKMGPSDIIKNGVDGFLTSLKIDEFTDKINELLENNVLRKKMGDAAKINASQYSVNVTADKMEKLYVKLANNHRS